MPSLSYLVNADRYAIPGGTFLQFGVSSGPTDVEICGANVGASNVMLVQGVDLVDSNLTENDDAWVYVDQAVGAVTAKIMRAFVYAQSQGTFAWRGNLPLVEGQTLKLATLVGTWEHTCWGLVLPVVSITP